MAACLIYTSSADLQNFDICKLIFSQSTKVYLLVSRASTVLGFVEGLEEYMMLPCPIAPHSLVGQIALEELSENKVMEAS